MKDKEIARLIKLEESRQAETLDLIASENHASDDVREAQGSKLGDKYLEGYPGRRYYPGGAIHDKIEILGQRRALKLFGLNSKEWHVNIQPLSGAIANTAVWLALARPGKDKIMGLKLSSGGHLTHGHKVSISGIVWPAVQYDVNQITGILDYNKIEALAKAERPKVIISGFTAYPRHFDFKRFSEIAKSVGAYHMVDISHIAGLVAWRAHPSPFKYADVVMTTTHKSLRGPRGAVIFCKKELAERIDKAVFPGIQGGPFGQMHAAKAICFKEAMSADFKKYAKQIVKNAKVLAEELKKLGFNLVTGGTDNHLMVVDVRNFEIDGKESQYQLEKIGITANMNTVPGDEKPLKPSGIRLGTPALTTRGMKEREMRQIAHWIYVALTKKIPPVVLRKEVLRLCKKFPI